MRKMIEAFEIKDQGYHPFLIRNGWQVAQLNYTPDQHVDAIKGLDVHHETDEVFILLKGYAILIAATIESHDVQFEMELLKPNITYNIPKGTWHNIAMVEGCELIIVEKSNTHISDFEHHDLNEAKCEELHSKVIALFETVMRLNEVKKPTKS